MEIGFVSFNQEALNRAEKVLKLLQGQGAIDELGLGRIRDAFSNIMFPGLSVLQTRAKYFCLLPAMYYYLERTQIINANDARDKVIKLEIALTNRFIKGANDNKDHDKNGIIGAGTLLQKKKYVKYDPTYVYMAGLETYGLVNSGANIYATLAERSKVYQQIARKQTGSEDTGDDSDESSGLNLLFLKVDEDYNFKSKDSLSIELTRKEAKFLKERIIKSTSPNSLLHFLLDSGLYKRVVEGNPKFEALQAFMKAFPDYIRNSYRLALRFSRYADLLRTRFTYLYDRAVGADEEASYELAKFENLLDENPDEFSVDAIREIADFLSMDNLLRDSKCTDFCLNAAKFIVSNDYFSLDKLINDREVAMKGLNRSKLRNASKFEPGKPLQRPAVMYFRWNTIGLTILKDIKEALGDE